MSRRARIAALILTILVLFVEVCWADRISQAEDVPATSAEKEFVNRIIDQVEIAAPALAGWDRKVRVRASGNLVRRGRPLMIFERARMFPLKISIHINFRRLTAARKEMRKADQDAQSIQQQMMAAAMANDKAKVKELQQQLASIMKNRMSQSQGAMSGKAGSQATPRKPPEFHVQVIVNGDGETIGKKYDYQAPGAAKAFLVDKNNKNFLSYIFYFGAWDIKEANRSNWSIIFPQRHQTPDNHLRAMVMKINVYGDRSAVDDYVAAKLGLNRLGSVVD